MEDNRTKTEKAWDALFNDMMNKADSLGLEAPDAQMAADKFWRFFGTLDGKGVSRQVENSQNGRK